MMIQKITSSHSNDFSAIMKCEHCDSTQKLTSGYNDHYYHDRVIPAMTCASCGKNRAGDIPANKNDNGTVHVGVG